MTLKAKWAKKVVNYIVTFDSSGGSSIASQTVQSGQTASKPKDPTKTGYTFDGWYLNNKIYNFNTPVTKNITLLANYKVSDNIYLSDKKDLISNSMSYVSMKNNTIKLQSTIDFLSENGGGTINLPAGIYYFAQGGSSSRNERYAIRLRNNVKIVGAGTNEANTDKLTVLKPYFRCDTGKGSMDMFYFNNYSDTGGNNSGNVGYSTTRNVMYYDIDGKQKQLNNQTVYLINADFSSFVIDGIEVRGCTYKTGGKGFMINLFKDCDWDNVVVKNTDATGFGMDCPINSTITNCMAINCGKQASTNSEGASGFGIGTGYSNNESIPIKN